LLFRSDTLSSAQQFDIWKYFRMFFDWPEKNSIFPILFFSIDQEVFA